MVISLAYALQPHKIIFLKMRWSPIYSFFAFYSVQKLFIKKSKDFEGKMRLLVGFKENFSNSEYKKITRKKI